MTTKITKKAQNVFKVIDEFIDYYQKAKGYRPEKVTITLAQKETLKIDCPHLYKGVQLCLR